MDTRTAIQTYWVLTAKSRVVEMLMVETLEIHLGESQ
jgi:uncharacterized protein